MYINTTFTAEDITIHSDETVTVAGGPVSFIDSSWTIGANFVVTNTAEFIETAFNGSSFTIDGDCSFTGASGNLLDLVATEDWLLTVDGNATASYVNVAHSDASGGSTVYALYYTSVNSGDNINWIFLAPTELGGVATSTERIGGNVTSHNQLGGTVSTMERLGGA